MVPVVSALVSILTRHLKHLRPTVLMYWFGVGAISIGLGGSLIFANIPALMTSLDITQWLALFAVCSLGLAGNILYTIAMKFVSPTKGNVFRGFEVITNCVIQVSFQGYMWHMSFSMGISFLLGSAVLIAGEGDMAKFLNKYSPSCMRW